MENIINRVVEYIEKQVVPVNVIITGSNLDLIGKALCAFCQSVKDYIFFDQCDFKDSPPQRNKKDKAKLSLIITSAKTNPKTLTNIIKTLKRADEKVIKIYTNSHGTTLAVL